MLRLNLQRLTTKRSIHISSTLYNANLNSNINNSNTADENILLDKIQLPQIDRVNTLHSTNSGIPGLFSENVLNDIWFNQLNNNLSQLKDAITQSTSNNYLECFDSNNNNNFSINSSNLESSNKIINQYKNLLQKISNKFDDDESYLFDLTSSIYNLFYFLSSLKSNNSNLIIKPDYKSILSQPLIPNSNSNLNSLQSNETLINLINKSFGSIDEFLTLLNDSSNSIKGNGYTWLIYKHIENSNSFSKLSHLSILNTYNNGLPHNFNSNRITNGKNFEKKKLNKNFESEKFQSNKIPSMDDADSINSLNFTFTPLFAIGSNPSFYIRDYGVFGKQHYINNVINCIDWDIINDRIPAKK
ncbi:hypothetical protein C6P42_002504 [Pichia californica]|nr:hypothetical protein C6P42_002504 [[Candida] californica]